MRRRGLLQRAQVVSGDRMDRRPALPQSSNIPVFSNGYGLASIDQVGFMTAMLEIDSLKERVAKYVMGDLRLSQAESAIAQDVAARGEVARGEAARITGLSERAARASATPKGPVSLRISTTAAQALFPRLF